MAKAQFQRNQKVWVESVGAWSVVEKVLPVWARGFEEPVRITYEVGFGRPFMADELRAEDAPGDGCSGGDNWRLLRARNKWQSAEDCTHHPYPGTFPVVVTDLGDWGGWRVPGAEYDRDPRTIEFQARLIASAPNMRALGRSLMDLVAEAPDDAPQVIRDLARQMAKIEDYLREIPAASTRPAARAAE
ncbi:MAG TPA: hypothetical protein VII63_10770 [Caulobacteraceae bacterium]